MQFLRSFDLLKKALTNICTVGDSPEMAKYNSAARYMGGGQHHGPLLVPLNTAYD